jgi:hypothetical protein
MNDKPTPTTAARTGVAVPRLIQHDKMQQLVEAGKAIHLSPQERHRIFVRYGPSWWIRSNDGYCEITGQDEIRKLNTWRTRLTEGPLWV